MANIDLVPPSQDDLVKETGQITTFDPQMVRGTVQLSSGAELEFHVASFVPGGRYRRGPRVHDEVVVRFWKSSSRVLDVRIRQR